MNYYCCYYYKLREKEEEVRMAKRTKLSNIIIDAKSGVPTGGP